MRKLMYGCYGKCNCDEMNKWIIIGIIILIAIYLITRCIIICSMNKRDKDIHYSRKNKAEQYSRDFLFETDELHIVKNTDGSYSVKKIKK